MTHPRDYLYTVRQPDGLLVGSWNGMVPPELLFLPNNGVDDPYLLYSPRHPDGVAVPVPADKTLGRGLQALGVPAPYNDDSVFSPTFGEEFWAAAFWTARKAVSQ